MKPTAIALLAIGAVFAQTSTDAAAPVIHSVSANFTTDIAGVFPAQPVETAWGAAGYNDHYLTFHPPPGYRVRILRLDGDFLAEPTMTGAIPQNTSTEVMVSFLTSSVQSSSLASPASEGCLIWHQGLINWLKPAETFSFDRSVSAAGLLASDNILTIRMAVALNTTGLLIHMEPTFNVEFTFEANQ